MDGARGGMSGVAAAADCACGGGECVAAVPDGADASQWHVSSGVFRRARAHPVGWPLEGVRERIGLHCAAACAACVRGFAWDALGVLLGEVYRAGRATTDPDGFFAGVCAVCGRAITGGHTRLVPRAGGRQGSRCHPSLGGVDSHLCVPVCASVAWGRSVVAVVGAGQPAVGGGVDAGTVGAVCACEWGTPAPAVPAAVGAESDATRDLFEDGACRRVAGWHGREG